MRQQDRLFVSRAAPVCNAFACPGMPAGGAAHHAATPDLLGACMPRQALQVLQLNVSQPRAHCRSLIHKRHVSTQVIRMVRLLARAGWASLPILGLQGLMAAYMAGETTPRRLPTFARRCRCLTAAVVSCRCVALAATAPRQAATMACMRRRCMCAQHMCSTVRSSTAWTTFACHALSVCSSSAWLWRSSHPASLCLWLACTAAHCSQHLIEAASSRLHRFARAPLTYSTAALLVCSWEKCLQAGECGRVAGADICSDTPVWL